MINLLEGGIFLHANDSIDDSVLPVNSNCYLDATGAANVSFSEVGCGDIVPNNTAGNDYTQGNFQNKKVSGNFSETIIIPYRLFCKIDSVQLIYLP